MRKPAARHNKTRDRLSAANRIIAANLRRLRLERGLAQQDIAVLIGVSYQQIQKYESGVNRISLSRLLILRDFYDVPLDTFIAGASLPAGARAPAPIDDPDIMQICHTLAATTDRSLRQRARRIVSALAQADWQVTS